MLARIVRWIAECRHKRAIRSIRDSMALFGYPIEGYTDEELVSAVAELGQRLAATGVTTREAMKAVDVLRAL